MSSREHVFSAAAIATPDGRTIPGAIVVVDGRIRAVHASPAAARRSVGAGATFEDLGDVLLAPAFVNAHAHLELSAARGAIDASGEFPDWIRRVIAWRVPRTPAELASSAALGVRRLLETGTTCVGDIDSSGAVFEAARHAPIAVRAYREALDAGDPSRTHGALERLDHLVAHARSARPRPARWHEGLSPHAPYTISSELWTALAARAKRARARVAIHFAETRAEGEWLEFARGPFAGLLTRSPRRSGLDAIEASGLLGPRTLLVHGNHATAAERQRIARSGAFLAHCPGTHAFFGREPFDEHAWRAAGVRVCLGTDSLASNEDLDMGRELALFAASQPHLSPEQAFACATSAGAHALGLAGRCGEIAPGAWADLQAFERGGASRPGGGARSAAGGVPDLEALVHGRVRRIGTWARGRRVEAQT